MAKKSKVQFVCQNCGYVSPKFLGRCPNCGKWNTMVEEIEQDTTDRRTRTSLTGEKAKPTKIADVVPKKEPRVKMKLEELNRVLGGGVVPGSMVLIGGDPGIGKSTLLLQVSQQLAAIGGKVLYVSGEESAEQIKLRAERLGSINTEFYLYAETDMNEISRAIEHISPDYVIIDSIQTMTQPDITSVAGSVSQVRETTAELLKIAKTNGIAIFIVGHVTKEGSIAGPRMLEHMVDTVLYFEGDRHASYRILRGVKNRFGSTNEIGVFEMQKGGLVEVENPSEYMLSGKPENASGSVVACAMEGTRPMLMEIQALVCKTNFGMPRRTAAGLDYNRVNLLMAVLEKRMGMPLSAYDAYVNIAGGIRLNEPAADLGIVMAIASSYKNRPIDEDTIVFGEVGLSGEVRAVTMPEQRVSEAKKLGFKRCIVPAVSMKTIGKMEGIEILGVENVNQAMNLV